METLLTEHGQTVVPAPIRKRHKLIKGTRLAWLDDGKIIKVIPIPADPLEALHGIGKGENLLAVLLEERKKDRARVIDLSINLSLVRKILTEFIRSEISRAGYSRAVVNLSGGLDSAVSCVLAAEALGAQNVLAVRLPYKSSSQDSLEHAQTLIDQFGVQSVTIPITEMVEPLIAREPEMSDVRKGNIMARARMIVAYDQSEAF
ncbi:MAG: NAD(+) synthase, partial [Anaerolinea sp.]|nr:NAD(+) synthase [Anaerolinea sp.]